MRRLEQIENFVHIIINPYVASSLYSNVQANVLIVLQQLDLFDVNTIYTRWPPVTDYRTSSKESYIY